MVLSEAVEESIPLVRLLLSGAVGGFVAERLLDVPLLLALVELISLAGGLLGPTAGEVGLVGIDIRALSLVIVISLPLTDPENFLFMCMTGRLFLTVSSDTDCGLGLGIRAISMLSLTLSLQCCIKVGDMVVGRVSVEVRR